MLTRKQAEDLAMELAIQSADWLNVDPLDWKESLEGLLTTRESILNILENQLHQIQE